MTNIRPTNAERLLNNWNCFDMLKEEIKLLEISIIGQAGNEFDFRLEVNPERYHDTANVLVSFIRANRDFRHAILDALNNDR